MNEKKKHSYNIDWDYSFLFNYKIWKGVKEKVGVIEQNIEFENKWNKIGSGILNKKLQK